MKSQKYIDDWIDFGNSQYGIPFDSYDLTIALAKAKEYAGNGGKVATLPDIVDARLLSPKGGLIWRTYDSTSFEYVGKSPKRNLVYVVAHGAGPLMSPLRIKKAITKEQLGNRLSQEGSVILSDKEFKYLLEGHFGEVKVFDFNTILNLPYPSSDALSIEGAKNNPLVRARLGKNVDAYLDLLKRECPYIDENSRCFNSAGVNLERLNINYLIRSKKITFEKPEGAILNIDSPFTRKLGYTGLSIHGHNSGRFIGVNNLEKKENYIQIFKQPITTNLSDLLEFVNSVAGITAINESDMIESIRKNLMQKGSKDVR